MSDVLDKIDQNLLKLENRLVTEFIKVRQTEQEFGEIGQKIKGQMVDFLATLGNRLEHSGDSHPLELATNFHEMLRSRLYVSERVLDFKIPVKFLRHLSKPSLTANEEHDQEDPNATITRQTTLPSKESLRSSFLEFFNSRFSSDKGSGYMRAQFADTVQQRDVHNDKGPYAAAYQLAMLTSVVMEHEAALANADFSSKEEVQQQHGRASFNGKDIPGKPVPKVRDIARSPEAIRKKLEARKNQVQAAAKATFAASDTTHSFRGDIEKPQAEKKPK